MSLACILTPSTVRHYPRQPLPSTPLRAIEAARNERFSLQLALRAGAAQKIRVEAAGPDGWTVRVRRVGLVPMAHHNTPVMADPLDQEGLGEIPGFVPDPLLDEQEMLLPQDELHAFWISVEPGPGAAPAGRYTLAVTATPVEGPGRPLTRKVAVRLRDVVLPPRRDFQVTHWFYNDQIIDWYRTRLFDERYWELVARYMRNAAEHGQNVLYVPVFTPPLDGVKSPSQLLRVARAGRDRYRFDWRDVRRYIRLAREQGITHFEWCHPFTQWGVRHAIRIYEGQGAGEKLLWPADTGATSPTYRRFLEQYLPALKRFLDAEGIRDVSFFHVSDEPHGEEMLANYQAARALLRELAPWMSCMDAVSQIEYARVPGMIDRPIPSISVAPDFVAEQIPCWCYYCCGPRGKYLNHLFDTPLAVIAMHGLLFYRWPFEGFLHWGLNYWCESQTRNLIDPFATADGKRWPGWAYGDPFLVYPGPEGPIDSTRWEIFAESLQDYALLQAAGLERDDPLLADLRSFADFPKQTAWRLAAKSRLYARAARRQRRRA
ncbi:MAG: DUF4091 domain-containing protein [Lentisphaerae bacterium]|nr:DUF4091 domain-containing protein [Lentisphaerota bacterium]